MAAHIVSCCTDTSLSHEATLTIRHDTDEVSLMWLVPYPIQ